MIVTPETWIISDTHFGHKNIVKYCNRPMNHNAIIHDNWVNRITQEDTVFHLGDLAVWYGPEEQYWLEAAEDLPGKKYMLRGNHDKLKDEKYAEWGYIVIPEFIQEIGGQRVLFSHFPDETRIDEWDVNIHGHIHNKDLEPRLAATGRRYINVSIEMMDYKPVQLKEIL